MLRREWLSPHLLRLVLGGDRLRRFAGTGVPDEWVALTVPGQYQNRYYTVRSWDGAELVLDVVVHQHGLVTEWAQTDCVGQRVTVSAPKGSFAMPGDAGWLELVGDLTALPAIARIAESVDATGLPLRAWVESPDGELPSYVAGRAEVTWLPSPADGESRLAELVEQLDWPGGPGYFWMAGESAQMRSIRRFVRRDLGWDTRHHDLMGYWSNARGRRARVVDPGPIYERGRAEGKTDEEIWAEYDEARRG